MAQAFIKIELKEGKVEMNMEGMTGELADLLIGALGRVIAGCSPGGSRRFAGGCDGGNPQGGESGIG